MFDVSGKTRNISSQLVLQQCCNTSCMFLVAYSSVPSKVPKGVTKPRLNDQTFSFNMVSEEHVLPLSRFSQNFFSISFDVSSNIFAYHKQMSDCLATAFCAWQLKTMFGENVWLFYEVYVSFWLGRFCLSWDLQTCKSSRAPRLISSKHEWNFSLIKNVLHSAYVWLESSPSASRFFKPSRF